MGLLISGPIFHSLAAQEIFLSTLDARLYSLDLENCDYELVGAMPISSTDISFHPNGNLYAITSGGQLHQIDVANGTSTLIHTFSGPNQTFTALTISATGDFYACGLSGGLFRYNLDTNVGAFLGNVGAGAEGDLTFYQGELYMAATDDRIIRVNIQSPLNSVAVINGDVPGRIFGIVSFAASCDSISVYALTDEAATVFEVDLINNQLTEFCNIPLQVSGGASTFEFLASNPITIEAPIANGFECGENSGAIDIFATGGVGSLSYSLDGQNYQSSPIFTDLPLTNFTIYVTDSVGCVTTLPFTPAGGPLQLVSAETTPTSCGENNGIWAINITGGIPPYSYTLNGITSQSEGIFADLSPGQYDLVVSSANGCELRLTTEVAPSLDLEVSSVEIRDASCGLANGALDLQLDNVTEPFSFRLNETTFSDGNQFENVLQTLPQGNYTLAITDTRGCNYELEFLIDGSPELDIAVLNTTGASCAQADGTALLSTLSGTGPISQLIGGSTIPLDTFIENLAAGPQTLRFIDQSGCQDSVSLVIGANRCPIYIPNTFSPNFDGINDIFAPLSVRESGIRIAQFQIFDRWGGIRFTQSAIDIGDADFGWDGSENGRQLNNGTYLYQIQVIHPNGEAETLTGTIQLLR